MPEVHLPTIDIAPLPGVHGLIPRPRSGLEQPPQVQEHIGSLGVMIDAAASRDAIGPNAANYLRRFATDHDVGYAVPVDILRTDDAQKILRRVLGEVGGPASSARVTEYLFENEHTYLAARVIGHGVLSLVANTLEYQAQGAPFNRALGLATLMTAHHPGFPISLVSTLPLFKSGPATIQKHERSSFFIDDNGDNVEVLRGKLIDVAAGCLSVPRSEAARVAILGYAFDRITPGKAPDSIHIGKDSKTKVVGGEVIQKKYGLVTGDLLANETVADPSIKELYATVVERLRDEADAAIQAAIYAQQSDLVEFIAAEAEVVISQTERAQAEVLRRLAELGLSGSFKQLAVEHELLLRKVRERQDPHTLYALATYEAVIRTVGALNSA